MKILKSSLDLNPALNLEWIDLYQIAKTGELVDRAFWLRFKDSKVMVHYSPFWIFSYTTLKRDGSTKELIYKEKVLLKAWSNGFEYCDDFLVDLGWDELEGAIVPFASDVQGWTSLELEDGPGGEYDFIYHNAPEDAPEEDADESLLCLLWPTGKQNEAYYFLAGEPYFYRESFWVAWQSLYHKNGDSDCSQHDLKSGDKWLPMFVK